MPPARSARPIVVFDLDGTLVDSLPDIIASFRHVMIAAGLRDPGDAAVRALIGKPLDESFALLEPSADEDALSDAYRVHYRAHFTDRSRPFPGVTGLLTALADRGVARAVATTKRSSMARSFVAALGLTPYLDHIQGTDDFPHKPAPDVILRALEAVAGEGVWMVGDTVTDIEAGKAAGLRTYAVTWGTHDAAQLETAAPDVLEPDLSRLLSLLG